MASIVSTDAWVSLEEAKDYANTTGNAADRRMEKLVNVATDLGQSYMQRKILSRAYTNEIYSGDGGAVLFLEQWPVTTLTKVERLYSYTNTTETWEEWHPALYTAAIEGKLKNSIWFRAVTFPPGWKNIRVTYTAGYSKDGTGSVPKVPQELKEAALATVLHLYKMPDQQTARIASVSFGGQTVNYLNEVIPVTARAIFKDHAKGAM